MQPIDVFEAMGFEFEIGPVNAIPHVDVLVSRVPESLREIVEREHNPIIDAMRLSGRSILFDLRRRVRDRHDQFRGGPYDGRRWGHFRGTEGDKISEQHEPKKWAVYRVSAPGYGGDFIGYAISKAKGEKGILIGSK